MLTFCPCCKQPIDLQWNQKERTLSGNGHTAKLSIERAVIFGALWRAWSTKQSLSRSDVANLLYGHRSDGGPETANTVISVQVAHLRKILVPFALSITCRTGYSLVPLKSTQPQAA